MSLLAGALFAFPFVVPAAAPAYSLRWTPAPSDTNKLTVEVSGLDAAALKDLRQANWNPAQWQRLLVVRTERGNLLADVGLPAMLGTYRVEATAVRFEPQFPLEPGVKYRASFYPDQLPGARAMPGKLITALFQLPRRDSAATTFVRQIYPSADVLPENLLKFYVQFSAPMSRGHIYDHIHLRNEAGKDVELPFLEIDEELWNPALTRLTLFIDPGRIKRGVTPLEEVGPALEAGKCFTLFIEKEWRDGEGLPLVETFRKTFQVGPPDRAPIDPATWKIQPPKPGASEPLSITFPKPLDHALAQRVIRVMDGAGQPVAGQAALEDQERRWIFTPARPWPRGSYALSVQRTIEDLAGNNIGKAFEVDVLESIQRQFTNSTVKLPFEIR